jgi:uncharacterized protein (DUF2141 family)
MRISAHITLLAMLAALAVRTAAAQDAAPSSPEPELAAAPAIMPPETAPEEASPPPELPMEAPAEGGLCDTRPYSMQISVLGVRESRGTITVDVHDDDPAKFLKSGGKLARLRVPAVEGETHFCVTVPKAGVYALAIYHDRNANTKLDKNFIGLPSEPFGLSNNPPLRLAMPKHRDSAFEVAGPRTPVVIDLRR